MELVPATVAALERMPADQVAALAAIVQAPGAWVTAAVVVEAAGAGALAELERAGWIITWGADRDGNPIAGGPFVTLMPAAAEAIGQTVVEPAEERQGWGYEWTDDRGRVVAAEPEWVKLAAYSRRLPDLEEIAEPEGDEVGIEAFDPLAGEWTEVFPESMGGPILETAYDDAGEPRLQVRTLCGAWVFAEKRRGRAG